MAYIEFKNITKSFGNTHVLKGIDLEVQEGELITLLGPSGCGKSTLLRCLAGLEEIQGGTIMLEDKDITHVDARLRQIGMVFQQYSLFPNMTVEQNLAFGLKIKKLPKETIEKEVETALKMVGLEDKRTSYPGQLSGGQQQRVALARAIVTKPKVLLLDEPLSAIDAKLRKSLQIEIRKIQKELNITTIFVTHDQDEAMIMSDRICLMNEGKIEQLGTPIEVYTEPKTKFAASFIGNYNVLDGVEFRIVTGIGPMQKDSFAIRPETISIHREKANRADSYEFKGIVKESRSRGNVLRYTIDVGGVEICADTLFRSFSMYKEGSEVWLSVEKRNCLKVAG